MQIDTLNEKARKELFDLVRAAVAEAGDELADEDRISLLITDADDFPAWDASADGNYLQGLIEGIAIGVGLDSATLVDEAAMQLGLRQA